MPDRASEGSKDGIDSIRGKDSKTVSGMYAGGTRAVERFPIYLEYDMLFCKVGATKLKIQV